jgi:hypothetical protein
VRWAVLASLFVGAYFGAIEPALGAMARWNARADAKEVSLTKFDNDRRARQNMDNAATLGVTRFGLVEPPGDASDRGLALNRKVNTILEENGIKRPTMTTRQVLLPANSALARHLGSDFRVERVINDIVFDAEPEQIAKVIADLERSSEVSSISRVQIKQVAGDAAETSRLVRATLAVEAWQYKKKERTK